MRRMLIKILLTIVTLQAFVVSAKAYSIKMEIKGLPDQYVYLAQYHGFYINTLDSAKCKNGIAEFKGSNNLPQGIYYLFIYTNEHDRWTRGEKLFDFYFSDNKMQLILSSDIDDPLNHLTVSGDETSKTFNEAQKKIQLYRTEIDRKLYSNKDSLVLKKEIDSINSLYLNFLHREMKKQKKGDFLYNFYKMTYAAQLTDHNPINDLDFSNPSIINTPEYSFRRFFEKYCEKNIDANADNVVLALTFAEIIVHETPPKSELREHILDHLVINYLYAYCPDPRLEYVACKLFEEYYKEKPQSMSDYDYSVLKWRYNNTKYNIIGMKGKDIVLPDQNGHDKSLYELKSKYKILVFWDSECEVCIEKVGYIQADYHILKSMGAEVFAVYTEAEYDQWKQYVTDNELDWINVSDPETVSTYDVDYGTFKSPRMYLLDENNIIIDKDFDSSKIIETINKHEKGN